MPKQLIVAVAVIMLGAVALEAQARNPAYYGTQRKTSARTFSGIYQATQPNNVPTFTLPVYGGQVYRGRNFNRYNSYYAPGYYYGGQGFSPYRYRNGFGRRW